MATTYTPDPTATQAPASQPDPDDFPLETLPASGDGATAASIAQAFKVLGDFIAWLKKPRAKVGAWAQAIRTYLNARLQKRGYINHQGYPMGRFLSREENWDELGNGTAWPTASLLNGWIAVPGTGAVAVRGPTNSAPAQPSFASLKLTPPTGAATSSVITRIGSCVPNNDLAITMAWDAALSAIGANRTLFVMGMLEASSSATLPTIAWGAYFSKANGDTNWQCTVKGNAGTTTSDSTVPPVANTWQNFSIEIAGANSSDNSAGTVIFKIDGAIVATIAYDVSAIPTSGDPWIETFDTLTTTTGGAAVSLYVGPEKYRQNTALDAY